jgi:UDP-N-acetylmuramoyl-tripeptide--D-alanyl-D-alanine ligase
VIEVTLADLVDVLGAELLGAELLPGPQGGLLIPVTNMVVDSRLVQPGSLFVALPGANVDGHAFVSAAFAAGASAAVTAHPVPDAGGPCLVTPDPLLALGRVARDQVDRGVAGGLRVVAVTGSQGKTSTKDLLAQVLETAGPTVAPLGNFNNEVGLPLTLERIDPTTRYLVAEMGARGIGHIAYLCQIAPPEVGIVLNVGQAHLGEFGSVDAIATAKGELVEALPSSGVAVLNADDPRAWAMQDRTTARVVGYSLLGAPPSDEGMWASDVRPGATGCCTFRLHSSGKSQAEVEAQLQVAGRHQVANALAAAAASQALGLDLEQIASGLQQARPRSRWRMELHRRAGGGLVINDAYNANPDSMRAAVDALVDIGQSTGSRTWAVLGDMLELGPGAGDEHHRLGRYAAERGVSRLVVLGEFAENIAAGASAVRPDGASPRVSVVADRSAATAAVLADLGPTDVVLVKASRGLALDTVAEEIYGADP